eukprot:3133522-Prymnesium_polylepis.1
MPAAIVGMARFAHSVPIELIDSSHSKSVHLRHSAEKEPLACTGTGSRAVGSVLKCPVYWPPQR